MTDETKPPQLSAAEQMRNDAAMIASRRHMHWHSLGNKCLVDDDISACWDIAATIRALPLPADPERDALVAAAYARGRADAIEAAKAVATRIEIYQNHVTVAAIDALHTPESRAAVKVGSE